MNGLFAWALKALGFEPRLLAGAVNRDKLGAAAERNHLALGVELDRPYFADVGFGNGFLEPLVLQEGKQQQGFLTYQLERLDEAWWRYRQNHAGPSYDFTLEPYDLEAFSEQCHTLQTSPDSGFVRLTVCHRFTSEGITSLRGAVLEETDQGGRRERVIDTFAEYQQLVTETFALPLSVGKLEPLWEKVWQGHLKWQASLKVT